MPGILDRYIAKLFLSFFAAGLLVFVTLFVTVDFMTNIAHFGAPGSAVLEYYSLLIPGTAYQLMPVACLLATIFTLSSMNRSNELVALFSSGMSLARISLPILTLVIAISGISFWLNDRLVSVINQRRNYVYFVEILKKPGMYSTVKTNKIWYRSGNTLFNIKTLQGEKRHAQGLTMYYFNNLWQLTQMLTADNIELDGQKWNLDNGTVTLFTDASVPLTQTFKTKTILVNEDTKDIQRSQVSTDALSTSELKHFIEHNREAGFETTPYEVDYQAKFSFAIAGFVMACIGIPFSVSRARTGGMAVNFGIVLFLTFAYYAAYSSGITLGQHGALSPILAVWLANVISLIASVVLLIRLKR